MRTLKRTKKQAGLVGEQLALADYRTHAQRQWRYIYVLGRDNFASLAFYSPVPPPAVALGYVPVANLDDTTTDVFIYGAENVPAALRAMRVVMAYAEV